MAQPPSRPEARRRFGSETANELGAPVASSIPEQLPGREPASTRKGYEDGNALFRWYRRVEGSLSGSRRVVATSVVLSGRRSLNDLKTEQVKRLKDLELENSRLRKALSDLTLDKLILQEAARGNT